MLSGRALFTGQNGYVVPQNLYFIYILFPDEKSNQSYTIEISLFNIVDIRRNFMFTTNALL